MKKIIILMIGMVLLATGSVFCMDIDNMMSQLIETKKGIADTFVSIDKDISLAARELSIIDFKSEAARNTLEKLSKNKDYLIDCAIVDAAGKMVVVEPTEYSKYEGSDISTQAHVIAMRQDKKPMLSDVFRSVEGTKAVDFEYPIFSAAGEFLGSVSMLVKQQSLTGDIIMPIVGGESCNIWIMQKDGLIIYDADQNQIGRNIFTDIFFRQFSQLISFSKTVSEARDGGGSYDFYDKGLTDTTVVKKYALWDTVSLYGTEWRIIAMEASQPEKQKK
ncbi:MAG: cache domain-containing protein [Candidatus Omnitrophica bacterium]|jgi:hypothetical protein|nr:cache domain-containing protein [Candidatus Omnitrophota bacterium]